MKFWNWFQANGDKVFNFLTLASVMLSKVDGLTTKESEVVLVIGILATAAHQSFFPQPPAPPAKDDTK
jgi:hypothetical protein